jgi:hypothetical protein
MKNNNKILVIGNDPTVNEIDFSKINDEVITLGTNRIWLKLTPDFLFFHDVKIFKEIENNEESFIDLKKNTNIITSDWLKINCRKSKVQFPNYAKLYHRPDRHKFVDCVSTSIEIMDRYILSKRRPVTYYVAGVSLKWSNPSHFWKTHRKNGIGNNGNRSWYEPRFNRMYRNFEMLKKKGFNIISVTPGSRLNKLFRYESIGNLYS